MNTVVVVSPHPDDETLGCAGTLLVHKEQGHEIHWIIMTSMSKNTDQNLIDKRRLEIDKVSNLFGFKSVVELNYETTKLDFFPLSEIISKLSSVLENISPEIIYIPHRYDAHSDHKVTFDAVSACTKPFRSNIKTVRCYETISETDFSLDLSNKFSPNTWIDISDFLDKKIEIMNVYESEMSDHPFPRSEDSIRSLAVIRGSQSGLKYSEAFMTLKQIISYEKSKKYN